MFKTFLKILVFGLFSHIASAQCDENGILLELQATTGIQGLLMGDNDCVKGVVIMSPLVLSNDTLSVTGGGSGTVISFSSGGLSPLFTTSVATATTTPALSFAQVSQSANTFYAGPSSGGAANPTFRLLTTGDITGLLVANNGVSDNEAGGVYRLGNRYMNSPDAPFTMDRKVNVADNTLFFGDNSDSTLLGIFGLDGRVGIRTTAASRALHVNGEVRITDLVTDTPTSIVGADADGDLGAITVSTGLDLTAGVLTSTVTAYTDEQAQDAVGTILTDGSIIDFTYSDATPSITATVINNSIGNAQIRQGVARSVIGVTGNATANVADIQGTADQVLRVTTAGTALAFGTVATGGLANDAVTYAKIQNVSATTRWLGRVTAGAGDVEELTLANMYTMLGLTGTANRFALWTGTNTLTSDAAFTFDAANDRATFTGTVTGTGAGTGILNLSTGALGAATTFLRMSGNVSSNMIAEIVNANNATTNANSLFTISTGGAAAGDPVIQFTVSGAMTTSMGIDNTDGDRFKITPNSATPGGIANHGVTVWDNAGTAMTGINKDFPGQVLDVGGRARSEQFVGPAANQLTAANVTFGTGAGTGPTLVSITGNGNMSKVSFTTGTAPTAGGDIFTITYAPLAYPITSFPNFCAGDTDSASEITKFYISTSNAGNFTLKANGTLTASTTYILFFSFFGY